MSVRLRIKCDMKVRNLFLYYPWDLFTPKFTIGVELMTIEVNGMFPQSTQGKFQIGKKFSTALDNKWK